MENIQKIFFRKIAFLTVFPVHKLVLTWSKKLLVKLICLISRVFLLGPSLGPFLFITLSDQLSISMNKNNLREKTAYLEEAPDLLRSSKVLKIGMFLLKLDLEQIKVPNWPILCMEFRMMFW